MDMTIRPMTGDERLYCYSQSQQLMVQTGCIGHLRGDMGSNGEQFFSTWEDHQAHLKTDEFKAEFDDKEAYQSQTQYRRYSLNPCRQQNKPCQKHHRCFA